VKKPLMKTRVSRVEFFSYFSAYALLCVISICMINELGCSVFIATGSCFVFLSFLMFYMRRMLTAVYIYDNGFTSKFLGKHLCSISGNQTIYYLRFSASYINIANNEFIVISNKPIKFPEHKRHKPIMYKYDLRNQIVLPYSKKINPYLVLDGNIKGTLTIGEK